MRAVVINNITNEIECILEDPRDHLTKKFYKFVRSAMFHEAAYAFSNRDLIADMGSYKFRMITKADYPNIAADFYINGKFIRHMIIAE